MAKVSNNGVGSKTNGGVKHNATFGGHRLKGAHPVFGRNRGSLLSRCTGLVTRYADEAKKLQGELNALDKNDKDYATKSAELQKKIQRDQMIADALQKVISAIEEAKRAIAQNIR